MSIKKKSLILVVDDDEGVRMVMEEILMTLGFSVTSAANGVHALQKISGGLSPDLVLCDINTPLMGGYGFTTKLREINPKTPVIIMTGMPPIDVMEDMKKYGIQDFVFKPVRPKVLKEMVDRLVAAR